MKEGGSQFFRLEEGGGRFLKTPKSLKKICDKIRWGSCFLDLILRGVMLFYNIFSGGSVNLFYVTEKTPAPCPYK
jgi:hypothetical protein